ncbi:hypothetical protein MNBD_BACTEROID05-938 [hydrothermal vent metagenome]|uniref:DUF4129 domain-containing protein n=1 Tax=hydrothermal vent metagenome TaxID=652676 RepID=A0A3B0TFY0_9ZZZZ
MSKIIFLVFILLSKGAFAQDAFEGLRDVVSPVEYPSKVFLILIILVCISVIAFICYLYFRKPSRDKKTNIPVKTSTEIALEQLVALAKSPLISQGNYKKYYQILSNIVRQYFEGFYHIRAVEMTSEEFLLSIKSSSKVNQPAKELLSLFLESCDMVKFAKYAPQSQEAQKSLELAQNIIQTRS